MMHSLSSLSTMASRCLEVTLGSTSSLKENKATNKTDPYAVLRLGDVESRTDSECVPGSRAVWNHRFNFLLPKDPSLDPLDLHVDVWDNSTGVDIFLGCCKVGMARVYQKRSMDLVQPVHKRCGTLIGHLRFHLAILTEDINAGPHTPPLPAHPPAPLAWMSYSKREASPPQVLSSSENSQHGRVANDADGCAVTKAPTTPQESAEAPRGSKLAVSSPSVGSLAEQTPKNASAEDEECVEVASIRDLLRSVKSGPTRNSPAGESKEGEGEEEVSDDARSGERETEKGVGIRLSGMKRSRKQSSTEDQTAEIEIKQRAYAPEIMRDSSPAMSPTRSDSTSPIAYPDLSPLRDLQKNLNKRKPFPLDIPSKAGASRGGGSVRKNNNSNNNGLSVMEQLMCLSPSVGQEDRPLAELAAEGPIYSPAAFHRSGYTMRPLPALSDLGTPSADRMPAGMDKMESDAIAAQGEGSPSCLRQLKKGLLKSMDSMEEDGPMLSRSSSGWDVSALSKLTSMFLNSQSEDTPGELKPCSLNPKPKSGASDTALDSQKALVEALTAALTGNGTTQVLGNRRLDSPSQRGVNSSASESEVGNPKVLLGPHPGVKASAFNRMDSTARSNAVKVASSETLLFKLLTKASSDSRKRRSVQSA